VPRRATKRGDERTPLPRTWDVLVCGASFAGLAAAREITSPPAPRARVLVLDRYEIGERQTSACAAPTEWLENLGLGASIRQSFGTFFVRTARVAHHWDIGWTWSTFDYRQLCELLAAQGEFTFETATVSGRTGNVVHTDRGDVEAPLIVDALGWRRVLSEQATVQPPDALLSRGLEVHPEGTGSELEVIVDPRYISPGYGWSFPAGEEVRVGVGSFEPRVKVREPTVHLAADLGREPEGYQGNWIPHWLRDATEDGVFFAGDSAGHCLPLTAEGIRTALYFGIACGRELRAVVEGRQDVTTALRRYHEFSEEHRWIFRWLLRGQRTIRHIHGPVLDRAVWLWAQGWFGPPFFRGYRRIAPPEFALAEGGAQLRTRLGDGAAGDLAAGEPAPEAVDGARVAA
jgi:flavin-dependent dehydrogenase